MGRSIGVLVIAALSLVQAVVSVLGSVQWFRAGGDDVGRGVLFIPLMGLMFLARGAFLAASAGLYALFAWAALTGRRWAWGLGLVAVAVSGLGVGMLIAAGESFTSIALRAIVPIIVLCYLISAAGRRALGRGGRERLPDDRPGVGAVRLQRR